MNGIEYIAQSTEQHYRFYKSEYTVDFFWAFSDVLIIIIANLNENILTSVEYQDKTARTDILCIIGTENNDRRPARRACGAKKNTD